MTEMSNSKPANLIRNERVASPKAGKPAPHAAGLAASPRAVTRGESLGEQKGRLRSKIDWLNATFQCPPMSVEGFVNFLSCCIGKRPMKAEAKGGLFGFETRLILSVYIDTVMCEIGAIAYGGEQQRGRWLLQLTGKGCSLVTDWSSLQSFLADLDAILTRCDVAVDFLDGEYDLDDAEQMVINGQFTTSGRKPSTHVAGDWLERIQGRTLYVGKAVNGKMLRVYEKGKQLGDLESNWVRYEVQFGNRDRVIPLDILTDPDRFFVGAYPALESMLDAAAESIKTTQTEGYVSLSHLLYHLRRCYGKAIYSAQRFAGVSDTALVEEMRVIALPRRVTPSSVVAGVHWSDVQDRIRRLQ